MEMSFHDYKSVENCHLFPGQVAHAFNNDVLVGIILEDGNPSPTYNGCESGLFLLLIPYYKW